MVNIPNIAVFEPHESLESSFIKIFSKNLNFTYIKVKTIQELLDLQKNNISSFNLIIVPALLFNNASAVTICIQLKAEPLFASVPIIVLSNIKDLPAVATFYGAGADVVMILPVDFEMLNCQVQALHRLSQSLLEEQQVLERDRGLRQAIISALHFVEEALVIFDPAANVVFSNQTAKQLLNLYDDVMSTSIQRAYTMLQNICLKAAREIEDSLKAGQSLQQQIINYNNITLIKNSGEKIKADVRVAPLSAASGEIIAYCLSIVDISAPSELSNTLVQLERAQSISIMLTPACMQLLGSSSLGSLADPFGNIEQIFSRQNPVCSLNSVTTALLEFLDNMILPDQALQLNIPDNINVAMKSGHLFILLGNLILFCMRAGDSKSETILKYEVSSNPSLGALKIRTINRANLTQAKDKISSSAIRTEILALGSSKNPSLAFSMQYARSIAKNYKLQILEKLNSDKEFEIEVEIPKAV